MDEQRPQVIVISTQPPLWFMLIVTSALILWMAASLSILWFYFTMTAAMMRFLEGIGGP